MADKNIKLVIEAVLKNEQFQKGVKGMGTQMQKTTKTAKLFKTALGALGIVGAIGSVVSIMKSALKTQKEFEQSIANVASVSGDSKDQLALLARQMGRDTIFTATEASNAMYLLASSGMAVKEMAFVLGPTLDLAAASQIGIAEATDIVVNNLKVFATEGIKAKDAVDIMAQTVRSSNTNMQQMGEALKVAGAEASLNGIKFADLNAIIGAMANQGQKGAEAGTKLRMVFARLGGGIPAVSKALEQYGIKQKEVNELLPTPIKLFERLRKANISNSDATKIFGVRNKAVFKLIRDGIPDLKKLRKALEEAAGAAKEMADIQMNTLQNRLKQLESAWQEFTLEMQQTDWIKNAVKEMAVELLQIVEDIKKFKLDWSLTINAISSVWDNNISAMAIKWESFMAILGNSWQLIKETATLMKQLLTGDFEGASKTADSIKDTFKSFQDFGADLIKDNKKLVEEYGGTWRDTEKENSKIRSEYWKKNSLERSVLTQKGNKQSVESFKKAEKDKSDIAIKEAKKRLKELKKLDIANQKEINSSLFQEIQAFRTKEKGFEQQVAKTRLALQKIARAKYKKEVLNSQNLTSKERVLLMKEWDRKYWKDTTQLANEAKEEMDRQRLELEKKLQLQLGITIAQASKIRTKKQLADFLKAFKKMQNAQKVGQASIGKGGVFGAKGGIGGKGSIFEEGLIEKAVDKDVKAMGQVGAAVDKTKEQLKVFFDIANKVGILIGGEEGALFQGWVKAAEGAVEFAASLGTALATGDAAGAVILSLTAVLDFFVEEAEKTKNMMNQIAQLNIDIMERVELDRINRQIASLENEKNAAIKRVAIESDAGKELKKILDKQAADKYAAMSASEKREFDLREKIKEDELLLEEKYNREIEKANLKKAKLEAKIQKAKIEIDWASARSEVYKNFAMPWDDDKRFQLLTKVNTLYKGLLGMIPSYQTGTEKVPKTGLAMLHKDERIVPAGMNLAGLSNADLMEAAAVGVPQMRGIANNTTSSNTDNSRSIVIENITLPNVSNGRELLMELQEEADSMGTSLLNN